MPQACKIFFPLAMVISGVFWSPPPFSVILEGRKVLYMHIYVVNQNSGSSLRIATMREGKIPSTRLI